MSISFINNEEDYEAALGRIEDLWESRSLGRGSVLPTFNLGFGPKAGVKMLR